MNEAFYLEKQASALVSLLAKGAALPFYRLDNSGYDPVEGGMPATLTVSLSQSLVGLSLPAKRDYVQAFDLAVQELLLTGKALYFLTSAVQADGTAIAFTPEPNDVLTFGGKNYSLVGCSALSPVGVPVIFKMAVQLGAPEFTLPV